MGYDPELRKVIQILREGLCHQFDQHVITADEVNLATAALVVAYPFHVMARPVYYEERHHAIVNLPFTAIIGDDHDGLLLGKILPDDDRITSYGFCCTNGLDYYQFASGLRIYLDKAYICQWLPGGAVEWTGEIVNWNVERRLPW